MSDLEKRTLVELRKMAKELGIPAISGLKKRELIEKIVSRIKSTLSFP